MKSICRSLQKQRGRITPDSSFHVCGLLCIFSCLLPEFATRAFSVWRLVNNPESVPFPLLLLTFHYGFYPAWLCKCFFYAACTIEIKLQTNKGDNNRGGGMRKEQQPGNATPASWILQGNPVLRAKEPGCPHLGSPYWCCKCSAVPDANALN